MNPIEVILDNIYNHAEKEILERTGTNISQAFCYGVSKQSGEYHTIYNSADDDINKDGLLDVLDGAETDIDSYSVKTQYFFSLIGITQADLYDRTGGLNLKY